MKQYQPVSSRFCLSVYGCELGTLSLGGMQAGVSELAPESRIRWKRFAWECSSVLSSHLSA